MEQSMCRICLVQNTHMYPILHTDLQNIYEKLTEYLFESELRPLVVCSICYTRLKQSHELMTKCFKSEQILTQMLSGNQDCSNLTNKISSFNALSKTPVFQISTTIQHASTLQTQDVNCVKKEIYVTKDSEGIEEKLEIVDNPLPILHRDQLDDTVFNEENDTDYIIKQELLDTPTICNGVEIKMEVVDENGCLPTETSLLEPRNNNWEPNESPYQCEYCHKTFKTKATHYNHIRLHTIHKPHKCDVCKKCFYAVADLRVHKRIHTGEKPYECNICKFRFSQKQHLKRHTKTHEYKKSTVKQYKCDICQNSFTQKGHLRTHIMIHTGEKPFQCKHCHSSFRHKKTLKNHICKHTGEKPFKCDICPKSYTRGDSLAYHIQTKHA